MNRIIPDLETLIRTELITVRAGPYPSEDEVLLVSIRQAVLEMKKVQFAYIGGSSPGELRMITPYGLIFDRFNYLVGAEDGSSLPRYWLLNRIKDLKLLEETGAAPAGFDLREYASDSFGILRDDLEDVVIRLSAEVSPDARFWRFHSKQTVEDLEDGSIRGSFRARGMQELA